MVKQVAAGRFAVLGAVRNCEKTVAQSVQALLRAVAPGEITNWFLVESDSSDRTTDELNQLQRAVSNFQFASFGSLEGSIPDRIARIAYCRQVAADRLVSFEANFDHVIVADFDGPLLSLKRGQIAESLARMKFADVITSNCFGPYYDILALRKSGWVEEDYRDVEVGLRSEGYGTLSSKFHSIVSNMRVLSPTADPIKVDSAFGGLAIYKSKIFQSGSYLPMTPGECEHVSLNRRIGSKGASIWIDPGLRVNPELRHVLPAMWFFRPLWWGILALDFCMRLHRKRTGK